MDYKLTQKHMDTRANKWMENFLSAGNLKDKKVGSKIKFHC